MKVVFKLLLVSIMFFGAIVNGNAQDKPKNDPKWPDIALQMKIIKYDIQSTNGDKRTYNVSVSIEVINFGEKQTPANKLNLKLTFGVLGPNDSHDFIGNGKTFTKVYSIQSLNQNQKQNVEWKFTYTTLGEIYCHDFSALVANKVPLELVVNNNKLMDNQLYKCVHLH